MASTLVFSPGFRVLDTDGNPVSGAQIRFFEAGTTTPKNVFSNANLTDNLGSIVYTRSDGYPVASEGSSTVVLVYTGEDAYKLDILRSDDTTLYAAQDNIIGAPSLTAPAASAPFVPVITTGSPVTLDADDRGVLYSCQSNTVTFPTAASLGDGWFVHIRNGGASGEVTLSVASGLSYQGTSVTSLTLEIGQGVSIACDGTAYRVYGDVGPVINALTALTSPATDDELILRDVSADINTKITLADHLKVVNGLTEDTTPDWAADFFPSYDASASGAKKVKLASLVASQATMETATSTASIVTPGRQHFHPGHPKAGGNFDGTGTPAFRSGDYGMGAITDNGAGDYTLALDTAFANTNYWCNGWARGPGGSTTQSYLSGVAAGSKTTSAFQVSAVEANNDVSGQDSPEIGIVFWGDYA